MYPSLPSQSLSLTPLQPSQLQKYLHGAEFYLEKGPIRVQAESGQWTEFSTIQKSSTGTLLFAETGTGKSSLISAFCGLKRNGPQASYWRRRTYHGDILTPAKSCHTSALFGMIIQLLVRLKPQASTSTIHCKHHSICLIFVLRLTVLSSFSDPLA